jgi:hypothetical protein
LDECLPRKSGRYLSGHAARHVTAMGWATIKNGQLLVLTEKEFDVFITVDRNLSFQQHLPKFRIAVLVLSAPSNRLADLLPLVPAILAALPKSKPGRALSLSKP